jgi:Tfp pilus assembly protein PilZ
VGAEKRRDRRYGFQIPGFIVRRHGLVPVLTGDVGFRGVLLRTDAPTPLRELLLLRFDLPPGNDRIELHAMAVWNAPTGSGSRTPGVGVQFYAVPTETQKRWNEFVRWVARNHPESSTRPVPAAAGLVDPVRRLHERTQVELEVRLVGPAGRRTVTTRYVSRGGMFVWTSPPPAIGAVLALEVADPSGGHPLIVKAVVRTVATESGRTGAGLELVGATEPERDRLLSFVSAARDPAKVEPAVFVAPDDPELSRPPAEDDLFADLDLTGA